MDAVRKATTYDDGMSSYLAKGHTGSSIPIMASSRLTRACDIRKWTLEADATLKRRIGILKRVQTGLD
ncbi:hypothetical protein ASPCADRAFT_211267 [Aspergillus carbonarius ITEM 5010]|uniref:Uncharacterized protein n=1 Tax=Aspergillus carbonarius (strain ITEM 5010) TaxID=602072 RepID=A0A1R3RAG3_ASPC5|nr:hypothetical protein ASPCADRAFT_211267 [Aspergillus carbonarius ITEM 5010]